MPAVTLIELCDLAQRCLALSGGTAEQRVTPCRGCLACVDRGDWDCRDDRLGHLDAEGADAVIAAKRRGAAVGVKTSQGDLPGGKIVQRDLSGIGRHDKAESVLEET